MILVDVNVLVYAKNADLPQHEAALTWLERQVNDGVRIGLPWESLAGFLRITTNPRIFPRPLTPQAAMDQVEEWLALPNVWTPIPTSEHARILARLLRETGAAGARIPDAHLAAIAIEHGLTLASGDVGFRAYPGLKYVDPTRPPA